MAVTNSRKRFMAMLQEYPDLAMYWDRLTVELDVDRFADDYAHFVGRQKLMADFFVSVWNGNDEMEFAIIEASRALRDSDLLVIATWLTQPFFPDGRH